MPFFIQASTSTSSASTAAERAAWPSQLLGSLRRPATSEVPFCLWRTTHQRIKLRSGVLHPRCGCSLQTHPSGRGWHGQWRELGRRSAGTDRYTGYETFSMVTYLETCARTAKLVRIASHSRAYRRTGFNPGYEKASKVGQSWRRGSTLMLGIEVEALRNK